MKNRISATVLVLGFALGAHGGDDPPKPAPPAPGGQPPAAVPPAAPPDPVKEQMFQDKAADDAFALMQKGDVTDVMEGLDKISKLHTGKVTSQVMDFVLGRKEKHVAEFAGFALSVADPAGTLKEMSTRLADPKSLKADQLEQMASLLAEVPAKEVDKLLANDRFLKSNDEGVRRTAIQGLGWHRSPLGLESTIGALESKEASTRAAACVALGRIGDKKAVDALIHHLDDKDGVGGFAAIALGRIEDDKIFPAVIASMQGGNAVDKCKAIVACARPAQADRLLGMVRTGAPDAKIAACAAISKLKIQALETQKTLLDTMLGDSDHWVRVAAFQALGVCCTAELAPIVAKRMGQQDDEHLRYVYEIAGDVGAKDAVGVIEEAMWESKHELMRRIATDAFWRIHEDKAVAEMEKKIRAATGRNFERAMDVLGARRNRNGFDLALELLPNYKGHDQYLVELALEKQTGHFFGPDVQTWKDWIAKNPKFFEKEQAAIERTKWREEFLKENKSTAVAPATEDAVQMALDYLARHQDPNGAFDFNTFMHLCEAQACPKSSGVRIQMDPVGMTGLAALAYFGAGCGPSQGRYRGVLSRAMEYMLSRQMANGDYDPQGDLIGGYNRPIALQAYAEAARTSIESQEYMPFVQRGVDFIANIQAVKGGWRYRVVDNANDTSVVAWVLFAAKAAEHAHAKVRRSIYDGADMVLWHDQTHPVNEKEDFIHDVDPNYGFDVSANKPYYEFCTGYQDDKGQPNRATTAIGLMSRILLGYRRSHPFCIGSANTILTKQLPKLQPKKPGDWKSLNLDFQYPMYTFYYCTLSMHQMGGKFWNQWNTTIKELLPAMQVKTGCARGSWDSAGDDQYFSRMYATAMGALTLETYYRYAPILQD